MNDHTSERPPGLRVGGYIAPDVPAPAPKRPRITLPDVADYWPDASTSTQPEALGTPPPAQPAVPVAPAGNRRTWLAAGVGLAVGVALSGGVVALTRLTSSREADDAPAAQAPPAVTISPATSPSAPPTATSAPPDGPTFEMVTDVKELSVRTTRLGSGERFRVSTPDDSGLRVNPVLTGDVLTVTTTPVGSGGSGRVEVLLSDRIVWRLLLTGGVERSTFGLASGTVSRIDVNGGALQIDMTVGVDRATVPIRMTGGVSTWRIRTPARVPVQVTAGGGAGEVVLYGRNDGGLKAGSIVRSGNPDNRPGISVEAVAGFGALHVLQL